MRYFSVSLSLSGEKFLIAFLAFILIDSPAMSSGRHRISEHGRSTTVLIIRWKSRREGRREAKWTAVTARKPRHTDVVTRERTRLKGPAKEWRKLVHDRGRRLQPHDFHEETTEILPMSYNNFSSRYCLFWRRRVCRTVIRRSGNIVGVLAARNTM